MRRCRSCGDEIEKGFFCSDCRPHIEVFEDYDDGSGEPRIWMDDRKNRECAMRDTEKAELARIVRGIPETKLDEKISVLWRRYAPTFSYPTFRDYLRTFRKRE